MQVRAEITKLEAGFSVLRAKAERAYTLLAGRQSEQTDDGDPMLQMLAQVEQRWEQQVAMIKRELHDTVVAHNHNADLMVDHKAAIAQITEVLEARGPPQDRGPDFQARLMQQLGSLALTLERCEVSDQDTDIMLRRGDHLLQRYRALVSPPGSAPGAPPAAYGPRPGAPQFGAGLSGLAL